MKIGCPKEIKNREYRVGLTPASAAAYVQSGHEVFIEKGAGSQAGFTDEEYVAAGARILESAKMVWDTAEMIVKVKEPLAAEYGLMKKSQLIFTYFHFAADLELTEACIKSGATCVAYEMVAEPWGLPLLQPMSEVAGRMSVIMGAFYLGRTFGGSGLLPMGVPGVAPANILVIGGGNVGINAAKVAAGLGARVTITDVNHRRLAYLAEVMPANCVAIYSDEVTIANVIKDADMVIGAVLLPGGAKAPKLVTRKHLKSMRPGSVFVDVAIDQGGVGETSRPTTHDDPIFIEEGVVHYCVANMPGAYARTATIALSNATVGYGVQLANKGVVKACEENAAIFKGLSIYKGKLTLPAVADALKMHHEYMETGAALKL
ncbi:MAG: alanine dehydrogenase [Synergistaceae bacterium]|nr:alanine dehydrogenase [Synergistaceae bacterium]